MDTLRCRTLFSSQPVARLATLGPDGPHIVPVTFAVDGDTIVTGVDHKPKRSTRLQRLANIAANASVALLADHYADDWERLWWVRADGTASIANGGPTHTAGIRLLAAKYEQYRTRPPTGPVIVVTVTRWSGWEASPTE